MTRAITTCFMHKVCDLRMGTPVLRDALQDSGILLAATHRTDAQNAIEGRRQARVGARPGTPQCANARVMPPHFIQRVLKALEKAKEVIKICCT